MSVLARVKRFVPVPVKHEIKCVLALAVNGRTKSTINTGGQHRIQVLAMRRSGHHAVTNWLMSAYEGADTSWTDNGEFVRSSSSGRVAFVNDLTCGRRDPRHLEILTSTRRLRGAQHLIVNYEDITIASADSQRFPLMCPDVRVYIRRPLVDLTASRLRAQQAWGQGSERSVPVNRWFVDTVLANEQHLDGWLVIDYDRWLTNADGHRQQVLDSLGLTFDKMPGVSPFGQGSSFSGTQRVPAPEELLNRHRQIDWPADIVELLLEPRYRSLLRPGDVEFLTGLLRP